MIQPYLLTLNAVVCLLIIFRIVTYRRNGAPHKPHAAWFAWFLLVACFAVIVRTLTGHYSHADWAEFLINVSLLIAVCSTSGNVNKLFFRSRASGSTQQGGKDGKQ